jgi:hypothetical protein
MLRAVRKKKRRGKVPGTRRPPMDVQEFEWHLRRRLPADGQALVSPAELDPLIEATVQELYGGWTDEAKRIVGISKERYALRDVYGEPG